MRKVKGIISLLLIFFVNIVRSDVFYNLLNREDPCINLCEKTPLSFANNKYVKSCCQRGCRFFNLVDLHYGLESNSLNGTRDACEASCTEAYTAPQDRSACSTGCDFMAKQRTSDLLSLFSVAIYVEEGVNSNIVLMSPDIPENDILSDPGLRKELLPGWWDSNGFKLPQTYIKTVPLDAGTVDYGIPSDYFRESDQSASIPGSDWLQCASKHIGLPHWLLASAIAAAALSAFWLCLYPEKSADPYREILIEKSDISPTFALYIPEAPLHKKPPPKYTESVDATESNMKV
ncbi:transmembrane protein 59-like isoform X1 [Megachile rotundata]|uniref:transmembrane protein 59-like isoform X1 n=1 Tax=Megachile rotundata TaxID=143995 RepID=UPI000258D54B|nr:PREDICTED: transmembrane protein 59-like isoform X1 [Megachile rotundata]